MWLLFGSVDGLIIKVEWGGGGGGVGWGWSGKSVSQHHTFSGNLFSIFLKKLTSSLLPRYC